MKVYFHQLHTEAHRRYRRGKALADAMEAAGAEVATVLDSTCQVALCGSFETAWTFAVEVNRHRQHFPLKVAYFCWDLYRVNMEGTRAGMDADAKRMWADYARALDAADLVLVPTEAARRQVRRWVAKPPILTVPPACDPWWKGAPIREGKHVLDVMRPYDDWGQGKVRAACEALGLPCVESRGELSFEQFQQAVIDAKVLACAYDEASTGGLTLLEGYALGKRVVGNSSTFNGVRDVFGPLALFFRPFDEEDLRRAIKTAWDASPPDWEDSQLWVEENYSDAAMARSLVEVLEGLL